MIFRYGYLRLLIVLAGFTAFAGDVEGPFLGYATDSAGSLRLIRGLPGAASWGDAIQLGDGVSVLALSQQAGVAAASTPEGFRVATLAPLSLADPGLPSGFQASLAVFSPTGSALAINGQGVTYLARNGAITGSALATGNAGLLAVSGGDETLIAGVSQADPHSVFVVDSAGAQRVIPGFNEVTGLTFVGNTDDLAIADSGARQIAIVRNALIGPPQLLFGQPGAAVSQAFTFLGSPSAPFADGQLRIASSANGNLITILAGDSQAGILYLANNSWLPFTCDCGDASPDPMRGNAVFAIRRTGSSSFSVLDADGVEPRLLFVPAEAR
jgi:hypothetical protein